MMADGIYRDAGRRQELHPVERDSQQIAKDIAIMTRPYPHVYDDLQMTAHAADVVQLDGARVFSVPSSTVEGRYYRVEEWRGTWKCTCPATKTECKHVRRVREVLS